jgi:uncharacterized membrane protein YadS
MVVIIILTIIELFFIYFASSRLSRPVENVSFIWVVTRVRVAMLLPVILIITLSYRKHHVAGPSGTSLPSVVPWFVAAFALLVAINSAGLIPAGLQRLLQTLSTWLLVISMSAIGMKAHLKDFATVGFKPILLMVSETVFLAILVIAFIFLVR